MLTLPAPLEEKFLQSSKYLLWLGPVLAGGIFASTLIDDVSHLLTEPEAPKTKASQQAQRPSVSAGQIAQKNLMGVIGAKASASADNKPLPTTRLSLTLSGTFTHSDPELASALISQKGKTAKRYKIGQSVPGGAKLHAVNAQSVTISRGGTLEELRYPKPKSLAGTTRTTMGSRSTPARTWSPSKSRQNTTRPNPAQRGSSRGLGRR